MNTAELYIKRCLQLAALAKGNVEPNPMVGAVLVYEGRIIGEGYHRQYGQAHAEVNCLDSVSYEDLDKIAKSTLYVSLEPCAHFGKTPPCSNLIIEKGIKKVVVGCRDPFKAVNGKGIEILRAAGVNVSEGILEQECKNLNTRFFWFHRQNQPYVILKWAQTANGFIGNVGNERLMITNPVTNRLVHRWRAEEMAILVGKNTASRDNPRLNTRHFPGKSPVRMIIDARLEIDENAHILDGSVASVVFNKITTKTKGNLTYILFNADAVKSVLNYCYENNLQSLIVEGGSHTLQQFINANAWNEARVITNKQLSISNGLRSPLLSSAVFTKTENYLNDEISYFVNPQNS